MWDDLKDWHGWLAGWPLYAAGVLGMTAMIIAVLARFDIGAALAGAFLFGCLIYSIRKDARPDR
jgi:hypothetical protein